MFIVVYFLPHPCYSSPHPTSPEGEEEERRVRTY